MDTITLFETIIYNSQIDLLNKIVDKFESIDKDINLDNLVIKFLKNYKLNIIDDVPVKKKRGRPPKNKKPLLLIQ